MNLERGWEKRLGSWQSASGEIQEQVVQGNRDGRLRDGQYWVGRRLTGLNPALLIHYLHFIFPREIKWDV